MILKYSLLLFLILYNSEGYRILVVSPLSSDEYNYVEDKVVKKLWGSGYDVTHHSLAFMNECSQDFVKIETTEVTGDVILTFPKTQATVKKTGIKLQDLTEYLLVLLKQIKNAVSEDDLSNTFADPGGSYNAAIIQVETGHETRQEILKIFDSLKQDFPWKTRKPVSDASETVRILQWTPQQSVLLHSKCILFVMQRDFLSLKEVVFGIPEIVEPVSNDRYSIVTRLFGKEFAKRANLSYDIAQDMDIAITNIFGEVMCEAVASNDNTLNGNGTEEICLLSSAPGPYVTKPLSAYLNWYPNGFVDVPLIAILCSRMITFVSMYITKRCNNNITQDKINVQYEF